MCQSKKYTKVGDYFDPSEITLKVSERITEVCIIRENGAETIDLTFGEISQSQIRQLKAEVAQLKSVEPKGFWKTSNLEILTGYTVVTPDTANVSKSVDVHRVQRHAEGNLHPHKRACNGGRRGKFSQRNRVYTIRSASEYKRSGHTLDSNI